MFTLQVQSDFYTIPYFATGALLFFVGRRLRYLDKFFIPALIAFGACIVRDLISALIVYMMAVEYNFGHMFARYMLPDAALTAVLMLLVYHIFSKIYQHSMIKYKNTKDFNRLD